MDRDACRAKRALVAAIALAGLLIAACGKAPTPATTPTQAPAGTERILTRGNGAEIDSLDPALAVLAESGNILRDIYEGLTALDADSRPIPAAAERWDVSGDGRVYTFHLRPTATWSNGERVGARDFVASWRRAVDPKTGSPWLQSFEYIEGAREIAAAKLPLDRLGVRAIDELTLEVRLTSPAPFFPALLSHWSTLPTYRGLAPARAGETVCNGAFVLAESTPNSHTLLRRNARYWNAANVRLDGVRYLQITDTRDELTRFRSGDLDVTVSTPLQSNDELRALVGDRLVTSPSLGLYYYGFNTRKAPFDSRDLRQALSMTVDREALTDAVIRMGNPVAYTLVPDGTPGYTPQKPAWAAWPYAERVKHARELYAKAGYSASRPLRFELRYNVGSAHQRIALAVAAMWKETLGVDAQLVPEEFKSLLQTIQRGDAQMFRSSWTADYPDAYSFLVAYAAPGSLNLSAYESAEFQRDLRSAVRATDPAERQKLLESAERRFAEDAPIVPIYFLVNRRLVAERVVGWRDNAMRTTYSGGIDVR
jgi:oligopeptide transport system substrate-binding protein